MNPVSMMFVDELTMTTTRDPFFSNAIRKFDNMKALHASINAKKKARTAYVNTVQYPPDSSGAPVKNTVHD